MEIVLTLAVTAGILLAIQVFWFPPRWLGWVVEQVQRRRRARDGGHPDAARTADDATRRNADTTDERGFFTRPFLRRRLDALAEELERLDRDPTIFAKAFHTMAARSAYEALLVDASRIPDEPPRHVGQVFDYELVGPSRSRREELEI